MGENFTLLKYMCINFCHFFLMIFFNNFVFQEESLKSF